MYLSYYQKDDTIPKIVELLKKEGYDLTEKCVKSWSKPRMSYEDVLRGIQHVKSLGKNIVVYTNVVFGKDRLSTEHNITIIDSTDFSNLCLKHKMYEIMDHFTY